MKATFLCNSLAKIPGQAGTSIELRPKPLALTTVEAPPIVEGEENLDVPPTPETQVVASEIFGTDTPSGCIQMFVNNPRAEGFFQIGKSYSVDFQEEIE